MPRCYDLCHFWGFLRHCRGGSTLAHPSPPLYPLPYPLFVAPPRFFFVPFRLLPYFSFLYSGDWRFQYYNGQLYVLCCFLYVWPIGPLWLLTSGFLCTGLTSQQAPREKTCPHWGRGQGSENIKKKSLIPEKFGHSHY